MTHEAGAIDYARLRALAEAAPKNSVEINDDAFGHGDIFTMDEYSRAYNLIEACDSATVLALLDERDKLRGAIREALAHWWDTERLPIEGYNPHFLELAEKLRAVLGEGE